MLQKIRDTVTGIVAVVIVGLLIITFAFWGIDSYFGQGTEPVIAKVNDKEIKQNEFQRAFSNYRLQLRTRFGQDFATGKDEFLKQQTLNQLIENEILNQAAALARIQISDQHVKEEIEGIDVFRTEGGFNQSFYELGIQRMGLSPALFETQLRKDLASKQLQTAIIETAFVLNEEAATVARFKKQERDITYAILAIDDIKASIEISDEKIQQYYDENKQNYKDPEQVKIAYLDLSLDKLAGDVDVNEEMLLEHYTANKAAYDVAEQRKFNQVLIKISENATEDEISEAKTRAEEIKNLIDSGKTFKEIAEEHSDDPGPGLQVNEYGFTQKGVMPTEVDEILFSIHAGEVSEMIQSGQGFHFIEIVDAKGEATNNFDNAKQQVEQDLRNQLAEERFFELADQMATLAYEHLDTLDIAAEAIGIEIQESELFSRDGVKEGLLAEPKIVSASFSDEVLNTRQNSDVLEISDDRVVVLRVIKHIPSKVKPLQEVRDEVEDHIKFLTAGDMQRKTGREILTQLREGKTTEEIQAEQEIEWKQAESVTRTDVSVNRAVLREAFKLGKPQDGKLVYGGTALGTGDYAVIVVTNVIEPETIEGKVIDDTRRQLQRTSANKEWTEFLEELRSKADIEIFEDTIDGI